jgi:hypothetical protein
MYQIDKATAAQATWIPMRFLGLHPALQAHAFTKAPIAMASFEPFPWNPNLSMAAHANQINPKRSTA